MDFDFTREQKQFQDLVRPFALRELAPRAAEVDREGRLPEDIVAKLGSAGVFAVAIPEPYGGQGAGFVGLALVLEEIAAACASTASLVSGHAMFSGAIFALGSEEQKRALLGPAARGEILGAVGAVGPGASVTTNVVATAHESDGYVLRGDTGPITLAHLADRLLVFAKLADRPEELVALIVRRDNPGLSLERQGGGLGRRAAPGSILHFEGAHVSAADILVAPGAGGWIAGAVLAVGRLTVAAEAVGLGRAAFEKAAAHVKEEQAKTPSAGLLGMQAQIADSLVELEAARLLTLRAARLAEKGQPWDTEGALAKLFASEAATRIAHRAMQIHGARGALSDIGLERAFRDAAVTELHEENSGGLRSIVGTNLLKS